MAGALSPSIHQTGWVCLHCGLPCDAPAVSRGQRPFCCAGCEAVFDLLAAQQLSGYYGAAGEAAPGVSQKRRDASDRDRFAGLDDPEVAARFLRFDDGHTAVATFAVPDIHCASCVWLLEQLWRFDRAVTRSEVDLQHRTITVEYRSGRTSVRTIAERLASLGYEPVMDSERDPGVVPAARRRLYMQMGVAGFAFGNIMLFSIPRYASGRALEGGFQTLFDVVNVAFAVPVLLFSARDYFRVGWQAVRARTISIEVPVSIGLSVLFGRSVADILAHRGPGFLDSFSGLVFFLLIGRLFQQKTFERLSFDRTFRSFLPLTVHVERGRALEPTPVGTLRPDDCIRLRRGEIVPADARVLDADALVDYRFLTGEECPVTIRAGERVRAGGRAGSSMRLAVLRRPSEGELAMLWANPVLTGTKHRWLSDAGSRFGAWFTALAIAFAAAGALAWWPDAGASASVATAVLIIACPCALTLAAPITLGTAMGLLGRRGLYLKDAAAVLDLSRIDTIVFDKTGTLTTAASLKVVEAEGLTASEWALVRRLAAESSHPVSVAIARGAGAADVPLPPASSARPVDVRDLPGEGLTGVIDGHRVAIGSAGFVAALLQQPVGPADRPAVAVDGKAGWVRLTAAARPGIDDAADALAARHRLMLVSGDIGTESARWSPLFGSRMHFQQSPDDKLRIVDEEKRQGRRVLMVGDGLNDAGALMAADVGLAVCDDSACIVPSCDGVIGGDRIGQLPAILRFARHARHVVLACFAVSIAYNVVGLTLALTGALTPLASAILMPVSSLTIVGLSSGGVRWAARRGLPA
jgi:P-type Cu+ transporter